MEVVPGSAKFYCSVRVDFKIQLRQLQLVTSRLSSETRTQLTALLTDRRCPLWVGFCTTDCGFKDWGIASGTHQGVKRRSMGLFKQKKTQKQSKKEKTFQAGCTVSSRLVFKDTNDDYLSQTGSPCKWIDAIQANLKHRCGSFGRERRMQLNYYFHCKATELLSFLESCRAPGRHAEYIHRSRAGLMDLVLLMTPRWALTASVFHLEKEKIIWTARFKSISSFPISHSSAE